MESHDEEFIDEDESGADAMRKLRERLRVCQEEKQEYLDGWQRMKAEFVNFRKQEEQERNRRAARASEAIFRDILTVLDSFDMALGGKNGDSDSTWRDGVANIHAQLLSIATRHGLAPFDALGELFDPARHESIGVVPPTGKVPENTVAEVVQKGYLLEGDVFRPAIVRVAQNG